MGLSHIHKHNALVQQTHWSMKSYLTLPQRACCYILVYNQQFKPKQIQQTSVIVLFLNVSFNLLQGWDNVGILPHHIGMSQTLYIHQLFDMYHKSLLFYLTL